MESEGGTMSTKSYYVRDGAPAHGSCGAKAAEAYVAAGRDGTRFPYWTWQKPDPLPLDQAEALVQSALRMGCRAIHLQVAEE
jgi:hypothetical protein